MDDRELIKNAEEELNNWITMHDGVVPSEDLNEFEKTIFNKRRLIELAKKGRISYESNL